MCQERPDYFTRLLAQHAPKYMWIGCFVSRSHGLRAKSSQSIAGPDNDLLHDLVGTVNATTDVDALYA